MSYAFPREKLLGNAENAEGPYRYRIVDVCEALHGAHTGSGDGLAPEDKAELRAFLQYRLDNWSCARVQDTDYDRAIKNLIEVTLKETA